MWQPNEITGFSPVCTFPSIPDLMTLNSSSVNQLILLFNDLQSLSYHQLVERIKVLDDIDFDTDEVGHEYLEVIFRLAIIVSLYLIHNSEKETCEVIPSPLSTLLVRLSIAIKRSPSLTYASYVLCNFETPPGKPVEPGDLIISQSPSFTPDEDWFIAVHLAIETYGGAVVKAVKSMDEAFDDLDIKHILEQMALVEDTLNNSIRIFPMVKQRLRKDIFINDVRPKLHGHGLIKMENVAKPFDVYNYVGETGAQSGVIRAIDLLLGINHSPSMNQSISNFTTHAPNEHKLFFETIRKVGGRLSEIKEKQVIEYRRNLVDLLGDFRSNHLAIVREYLTENTKGVGSVGTGGTQYEKWLSELINETKHS